MSAALERRSRALVDREPGAGDLGAAGVVDDVERLAELPVRYPRPGRATRRGVGADLADERLVVGQLLAPQPEGDVRLLATDRDVEVGRVGDAQEQVVEVAFGLGQGGVEGGDPDAGRGGRRAQVGDLGAIGRGARLDRLADLLRDGVPFGLERLVLGQQPAPLGVELDGAVDERRVLALPDRRPRGWRRHPRGVAAGRRSCRWPSFGGPARSFPRPLRSRTPDRGRPGASRLAVRSDDRGTRGRSPRMPVVAAARRSWRSRKISDCQASPPAGASRSPTFDEPREEASLGVVEVARPPPGWRRVGRPAWPIRAHRSPATRAPRRPVRRGSRARARSADSPSPPRRGSLTSTPGIWTSNARCEKAGRKSAASAATSAFGSSSE